MAKKDNTIKISPDRIEEAIAGLNDLLSRLRALDADKDKLQGDSGTVAEEMKEYDRKLTMVIAQLKTLITFTIRFLQKMNNTFIETDQNIAGKM